MLKLKTTAKEAAAELKRHGYHTEWKVGTRTYEAKSQSGEGITIYALHNQASADSRQKETELAAAFPGIFDCQEPADAETTAEAPESAETVTEATAEGSAPTEAENAAESVSEGLMEMSTPGLIVSLPKDGFTEASIGNLRRMVEAKATLISKALGTDRITIDTDGDEVSFPWWDRLPTPEETQAYMAFIAAICKAAKEAKRVNAKEREVESERYAFRSFLLRLGFIGPGCAAQRKTLLSRLSGSASFPSSEKYTAFCASQKEKRDAAKEVS